MNQIISAVISLVVLIAKENQLAQLGKALNDALSPEQMAELGLKNQSSSRVPILKIMLQEHNLIPVIKLFRSIFDLTLKEAKAWVDQLMATKHDTLIIACNSPAQRWELMSKLSAFSHNKLNLQITEWNNEFYYRSNEISLMGVPMYCADETMWDLTDMAWAITKL